MNETEEDTPLKHATRPGLQYAALPYRLGEAGVEILLVTSRETQRWVIPKGWPMKDREPHAAAAREALEEAGVAGKVAKEPIGAYRYVKRLKNGAPLVCSVDVFPLLVSRQRKNWREQGQRTAHWFTVEEAAEAVQEPELQDLIARFGRTVRVVAPQLVDKIRLRSKG
ncbi:MAG: NUDIX hydrolase [Caulobacteraceae bacterium]|nr:NUDIX hydrolase [Caulobacteraceae bacterium]